MTPKRNPIVIFGFICLACVIMYFVLVSKDTPKDFPLTVPEESSIITAQTKDIIISDEAMVYGPSSIGFSIEDFIGSKQGHLASYTETVNGANLSASEIIQKVSEEYSVNPRLLIAIIEYQSNWWSQSGNPTSLSKNPVGADSILGTGLFIQLSRTADLLNFGFYARKVQALDQVILLDGKEIYLPDDVNAGTAGLYNLFSSIWSMDAWQRGIGAGEFLATYHDMFETLTVDGASVTTFVNSQPPMQLPFEENKIWAFTGGPHSAWGRNSAWAALDFAPPKEVLGCVQNDEWVTAVADGIIVRSEDAVVLLDLDQDGHEQSGWVVFYFHIETRDRIAAGSRVKAGQRIGHASCEGGISTGTHIHIARKYNGEWIPADQDNPFVLDGWVSAGTGIEYNGTLQKEDRTIEALDGRQSQNQISR